MRIALTCLAVVLSAGCRTQNLPVQLQGEPTAIAWLAGDWGGEYWGGQSGRSGTINFFLAPGTDSAYGDVTMLTPVGRPLVPVDAMDEHRLHVRAAQSLRIDFVSVAGGEVTGMLEPYLSPDCDCAVSTTFRGRVSGNVISGTFVTSSKTGLRSEGLWRVTRRGTTQP
ncbi:MAG TPA: hypothetical protein VFN38_09765 [Gemmatimonadaceae bacterium]|nr:hypothetical protein [Gemmatimonadaceae bacterium]